MNTACPLLLSVILSLVLCSWGSHPSPSTCSGLASGVLYGAFSLKDLFPIFSPGCSWTLENPDPTKYTLYLKFTHEEQVCSHLSPMVQPLDHYLPNHTCSRPEEGAEEAQELCTPGSPFTFLHFDKNFLRLCLSEQPLSIQLLPDSVLSFRFVEVLLVNHDNSSQFACGVLCRWFEECLRARDWGVRCALTQTGCTCPETASRGHNDSVSNSVVPAGHSDCCVTQLLPGSSNGAYPRPIPYGEDELEENQKVKTQRPRSADEPAVYMAQTGDPAAEGWSMWGVCSMTCGQGVQTRIRSCVSSPYGTLCSGPLRETRTCNNTATCPVEGQWLEWGAWEKCSVTCFNGTQQRSRRCANTNQAGRDCRGQETETRECSNPDCPASHEVCKDEYVLSMSWKKASAGEIVYNKCPPNATGSASRRCLLSPQGVAYWSSPSFARCVSHEYRYLHIALREHLAKGQRVLAGQGMSQVVRSMLGLVSSKNYYSGDLLFCVDILRNVTDTYKRATYIPSFEDIQKFFHAVSHMLDAENREKWEDAQQVAPGSILLMKVLEDYIHLIGDALKPFQSSIIVTENLVISIQREPVSAVSSDINFPMKGRRGMNDWARNSEDKLFIPKEVLSLPPAEAEDSAYFVIGAVLYRTLGLLLPPPGNSLAISSKVLTVTVRPLTKPAEQLVVVELSHIINGTSSPQCAVWDYSKSDASTGNWDTESCQTLPTQPSHTKCLCDQLSTFAILAQLPKEMVMDVPGSPSVPLMIGCAVSCMALLILLAVYAAFWRFIRSERSIILLNFCLSILASNILILVGQSQALSKAVCALIAAFLHFFFLSSFCWVLTEAWQSYLAVIGQMRTRLVRKRFLCLGWGLPALVVAVSVGFTRTKGYGTPHYCWLSLEGGLLYAFVGPAAVIVLVNMLIGIIVFNKLMSRDGISDKSKKQRAGGETSCRNLLLICSTCGVLPSAKLSAVTASNAVASLWSSCVVLPLLALTWMSAVLAMTDRRSILFQVLFAVFNSVQGCVIITVHCFLRREVQEVVKCQIGGCRSDENEDSPNSCKNGQLQIMTDFEKDVDLACQSEEKASWYTAHGETVLFKELNTCHPSSVTGALSRISLDDEDDLKLHKGSDGLSFSHLPGNISSPGGILLQVPKITHNPVNELNDPLPKKEINLERGPLYISPDGNRWPMDFGDGQLEPSLESEYMVLPRRTLSLKPFGREHGKLNVKLADLSKGRQQGDSEGYPSFLSVDHINVNLTPPFVPSQHQYGLPLKQPPSVRQILASEMNERSRTMPRTVPGPSLSAGSLEKPHQPVPVFLPQRKRLRYSDLDFEKVMHTRKRHSELYHELNRKFHTLERYRDGNSKRDKRWSISSGGGVERTSASEKTSPAGPHQKVWDSYRARSSQIHDRLGLHCVDWNQPPRISMDVSDGDYQTEV
ncbi:adhesion G protein-coupled receptor B2 isoform X4 [Xenopus tropicalis]|uniref:Adhesion G protein-coupled receptor B2 n=1 Tax=Xenopus tropicalis TaxID=8364 RepID=A0A6I8SBY1_XENTR|nr:adhesion G protein-coupled receptor B2 isoform X4 [Xenopus tropicalis]|eukprot:XP_004919280.1 PREDICTED: adhesion G protein-coupled receptor B2 isoform X4 [Xenopus tropicalis]